MYPFESLKITWAPHFEQNDPNSSIRGVYRPLRVHAVQMAVSFPSGGAYLAKQPPFVGGQDCPNNLPSRQKAHGHLRRPLLSLNLLPCLPCDAPAKPKCRVYARRRAWARCRGTGLFGSLPSCHWQACSRPPAGILHLDDMFVPGLDLLGLDAPLLLTDLPQAHARACAMEKKKKGINDRYLRGRHRRSSPRCPLNTTPRAELWRHWRSAWPPRPPQFRRPGAGRSPQAPR